MDAAVCVQTLDTPSGQVTLIVNDASYWKAQALGVIVREALQAALSQVMVDWTERPVRQARAAEDLQQ